METLNQCTGLILFYFTNDTVIQQCSGMNNVLTGLICCFQKKLQVARKKLQEVPISISSPKKACYLQFYKENTKDKSCMQQSCLTKLF